MIQSDDPYVNRDDNRNVSYLWSDDANRKLNLNWADNAWNSDNLVLCVCDCLYL